MVCSTCQRPVDAEALFCAGCGAPVAAPTTVELPEPEPALALPESGQRAPAPAKIDNRTAAFVALAGALLAVVGAFQVWLRIRIADLTPPGSAETGWSGGDGRTIVVAAAVAAIAAAGLLVGRRDLWLKAALLVTGGVTLVIAVVNMLDVGSKARDIEVRFGIPEGDVRAQVGYGLYLVLVGGAGVLAAGLRARSAAS